MSKLTVYDRKGGSIGDVEIADGLLVLDRGSQAVHDTVVAMINGQRAGTACTKCKSEVAGSGKKPWRQKGTGRARAGYRQSPVWRGGGVAFGPKPRSYAQKVNRKVSRLAFRRALSEKIAAGDLKVVDALELAAPKTKDFMALMKALGVSAPALVVVDQLEANLVLASRNVARVELTRARDVNVYQLLRYPVAVVSRAAMDVLKARLEEKTGVSA